MADQTYWDDIEEGAEIALENEEMSSQRLVVWAAASGDFYQVHYDIPFAKNTGLDGIIVHGALKNAFLGQLLHEWVGPKGTVREFGCSYRGMDYPDQDILCKGIITSKSVDGDDHVVELDVWTENPDGQKTTPGTAKVTLPAR